MRRPPFAAWRSAADRSVLTPHVEADGADEPREVSLEWGILQALPSRICPAISGVTPLHAVTGHGHPQGDVSRGCGGTIAPGIAPAEALLRPGEGSLRSPTGTEPVRTHARILAEVLKSCPRERNPQPLRERLLAGVLRLFCFFLRAVRS